LFYDTFNAPNNTLITARAPDIDVVGGGWVKWSTQAQSIRSNVATVALNEVVQETLSAADVGKADVTITSTFLMVSPDGRRKSIVLRLTDYNNCWICSYRNGLQAINIYKKEAGVLTSVASGTKVGGGPFLFTVSATGSTITFTVDGTTISYSSATFNQSATRHGMEINSFFQEAQSYADNFQIIG
jgi:hypothetical protein